MGKGWICLHRSITENDLWEDRPFARGQAWIDLILRANHETRKCLFDGSTVEVERGSFITSIRKLSDWWGWSRTKTVKFLDDLESDQMIERKSDTKKTLITLVNYGVYQNYEPEKEPPKGHENDTKKPQKSLNNNDNNNNKDIKHIYGAYKHVRLKDSEREELVRIYGEEMTDKCITFLDEYIEMKGYKAKSHYLCIKKWVVGAVKEKGKSQGSCPSKNKFHNFEQRSYDMGEMEKKLMDKLKK